MLAKWDALPANLLSKAGWLRSLSQGFQKLGQLGWTKLRQWTWRPNDMNVQITLSGCADKKKRLRFRMCCGNLGAANSLKRFGTVTGVNQDELLCLVTVKNKLKSFELPLPQLMSWLWLPVLLFHLHVLRL